MFVCLGMSALIPITSGVRTHGIEGMNRRIALFPWLFLEFFCYLLGAILFAVSLFNFESASRLLRLINRLKSRIPERLSPGTFDIFGSSHQIFHVLILLAASFHLKGLLATFDWNHRMASC